MPIYIETNWIEVERTKIYLNTLMLPDIKQLTWEKQTRK